MSTFDSTKRLLPEILNAVIKGQIQLPDFQRGWIWDDAHVKSLLVSVARSFPVGAVMLLENGGEARFQVRPVENVTFLTKPSEADSLILDGQQRLTTLTQVLALKGAVKTRDDKGRPTARHYYFDIETALSGPDNLDDALLSLEEDRKIKFNFGRDIKLDLSTRELECKQLYFPCSEILNSDGWEESLQEYSPASFQTYMKFRKDILGAFRNYQLPVIELKKETSKEAVCLVFEKVNTGGVPLSVFELVTATYAASGYNLRDDWFGSELRHVASREARLISEPILKEIEATDFLQAITILHTLEARKIDLANGKIGKQATAVSAKRSAVLNLDVKNYKLWTDAVEQGFLLAAKFLRKECLLSARDLPYRTQLVPLAAALTILKERWLEPKIHSKIVRWYWCGVLGELYGGAVETRIANDVEELINWTADDAEIPRTVLDANFREDRLDRLTSRSSAAYKGIHALVLRANAEDFFWKAHIQELDFEDVALDIHHIFPKDWCEKNNIPRKEYDSIINKTPISYKANRMIGGIAPSKYIDRIQQNSQVKLDNIGMNKILISHLIPPNELRSDDFKGFYLKRKSALLSLIAGVMGRETVKTSTISDASESGIVLQ